jgi:O-antigen ligase
VVDTAPIGSSFGQRIVMWRNTIRMIADHPVFGVGTGQFLDGYRLYLRDAKGWQNFETGDPHSQFMKIQAEQGIFGLAAILLWILTALSTPATRPYRQIAVAILIGWCATSLANAHFSTFVESRLLFLWIGILLAAAPDSRGSFPPVQGPLRRIFQR